MRFIKYCLGKGYSNAETVSPTPNLWYNSILLCTNAHQPQTRHFLCLLTPPCIPLLQV